MPRNKGSQPAAGANKTLETSSTSAGMAMAKMSHDGEDATDYRAVFVDTNLDTHLAIPVSFGDTAFDLKRKIRAEHSKCFLEFGEIEIHDLKVRCKGKHYTLSELMPVRSVFDWTKKKWFVFADISSQFDHHEAADHNTKIFADLRIRMLPPASPLQGGHEKDERNIQNDNLSGEARSETLQLVTDFNNDDNAKTSSSDTYKRLNAVVENICNFSFDKEKVTGLLSERKGRNSIGLLTEATSDNQIGESLEKNKPKKKKRKITTSVHSLNGNDAVEIGCVDKDSAGQKLEIMMSLDQNVDDCKHCDHSDIGVGSAGENKREDKSSEINHYKSVSSDFKNRSAAEIERSLASCGEEDKILESHHRDTQEIPIEKDMTKGTPKKKNKMAKAEMMNLETFSNNDALDTVSTKSHALAQGNDTSGAYKSTHIIPDSGRTEKHNLLLPDEGKNMNMDVQCNSNNVGSPMNLAEDVTKELVGHESVPDVRGTDKEATTFEVALDSGMRRSKKRKNGGDDVPLQVDTKGSGELGLPNIEDKERQAEVLAELPDLGMTRPLKRKKTGFDWPDVIKMVGVCDENPDRPNSNQQSQTKKSKKKTKQKQIAASMGDQMDAMDTEKSKSIRSKSGDEKNDNNIQSLSSACEQTNIVAPVVTSEADIETTTKICVDEEVLITSHEIDVKKQQGADANIINDAEPMQLTQVQKSEDGVGIKNKRSSKKTKQKHDFVVNSNDAGPITSHEIDVKQQQGADVKNINDAEPMQLTQVQKSEDGAEIKNKRSSKKTKQKHNFVVNMSEFPVEEQKNNLKIDRSNSACTESATEKNDEMELSSSFQEKIDKAVSVADTNADIERRNADGFGVDDNIIVTNHGSGVIPRKEADATMQYDAEPMQLTHIQKSEKKNGSKSEKPKKKIKQKQSHPLKSISEFSVEDQNNSMKLKRSKSTLLRSEAEKDDGGSLSSPVEQIDNVALISAPQADAEVSKNALVDEVMITNHGSDVSLQQEADDNCQDDVEPIQLTQAQRSKLDTENKGLKNKKKTKKNVPKVVEGEPEDARNGISIEKDQKIAPVEIPLNSAKSKGSEKTSSGLKHLKKSSVVGQSANADKQDRSISSAEQYAAADPLKSKVESSSLKTKDSGILNKRSHQGKATKELPKMKQHQSNLHKSSNKSTQKAVHNPSKKETVLPKSDSFFKDESSSSAETKGGGDVSGSITENPYDDHVSSSEDESEGSWASPKHGNSKNGEVAPHSKPMEENLTMESILRSSHKYKKAKLVASQLQLQEDESQPVEVVPDSQANT